MTTQTVRLLFFPREKFPTHRVRITALFFRELFCRGHEIDLVMQAASGGVEVGAHSTGGRTVWVGPTDTGSSFYHRARKHVLSFVHDLKFLVCHLRRKNYDAVKVSDKFLTAICAMAIARLRGVKFFFWLTFPIPEAQLSRARDGTARYKIADLLRGTCSKWVLYKVILPHSDYVFVQSERMKQDVCKYGINPNRVSPVVSGVDLDDFPSPAPRSVEHQTDRRPLVLVYLGTLASDRKLEIIIDMLAILLRDGMNCRLVLIGDGNRPRDRVSLETRARALEVQDRIEITGFLPQAEALRRASTADIALSPIYPTPILQPGSPTKLVEYMALQLPVVANTHPEQRLVLRESRAGICVPWGSRYFARGVKALARLDSGQRAALGVKGREWVAANRTYARIADDLERKYIELLIQPASRNREG